MGRKLALSFGATLASAGCVSHGSDWSVATFASRASCEAVVEAAAARTADMWDEGSGFDPAPSCRRDGDGTYRGRFRLAPTAVTDMMFGRRPDVYVETTPEAMDRYLRDGGVPGRMEYGRVE